MAPWESENCNSAKVVLVRSISLIPQAHPQRNALTFPIVSCRRPLKRARTYHSCGRSSAKLVVTTLRSSQDDLSELYHTVILTFRGCQSQSHSITMMILHRGCEGAILNEGSILRQCLTKPRRVGAIVSHPVTTGPFRFSSTVTAALCIPNGTQGELFMRLVAQHQEHRLTA